MPTVHEMLGAEGPHEAPEPQTAEERSLLPSRPSRIVALVGFGGLVAFLATGLEELGLLRVPRGPATAIALVLVLAAGVAVEIYLYATQERADDAD